VLSVRLRGKRGCDSIELLLGHDSASDLPFARRDLRFSDHRSYYYSPAKESGGRPTAAATARAR
jgi:hypothetical protein